MHLQNFFPTLFALLVLSSSLLEVISEFSCFLVSVPFHGTVYARPFNSHGFRSNVTVSRRSLEISRFSSKRANSKSPKKVKKA